MHSITNQLLEGLIDLILSKIVQQAGYCKEFFLVCELGRIIESVTG